jgi:uncharacterized protein GlcG (DUF336 family)
MKILLLTAVLAGLAGPALGQIPQAPFPLTYVPSVPARIEGMPRDLPRAKGPSLNYAIQLAKAAVDECAAKGERVSVLVTDSVGEPVVLLSGDGAGMRSQLITSTKAAAVVKYRMSSAELAKKAKTDPQLAAEIAANPNIGTVRAGALLLMSGTELVGALAVSGSRKSMDHDEVCAQAALAKVPLQ